MNFHTLLHAVREKRHVVFKTLIVMKLALCLICVTVLQAAAFNSKAQTVTLDVKNAPLKQVFNQINQQTGYIFFYEDNTLDHTNSVTLNVKNAKLKETLDQLFKNQDLEYTIAANTIGIKKKELSFIEKLKTRFDEVTVQAVIKDESGQPMRGVTITIKETQLAVASSENGQFTIGAPSESSVLVFTHVGYEPRELRAKDVATGSTITMKATLQNLKEVVINKGYYVERQELSAGDVGTVTSVQIAEQPVTNPLAALIGRIPGVVITQNTGVPGGSFTVQIRGQNSIAQKNDPFYIVDGVPYQSNLINNFNSIGKGGSPLSFISPADIESISVLKDADATAIYGSRGANGVILITTKKGKAGLTTANFNVSQGIGKVSHMVRYMNTEQHLQMRHSAFANDGATPQSYDVDVNGTFDTTRYTDWQKELIGGTAHYSDAQGSVSGGNTNTQYLLSGTYHRETSVFPGTNSNQKGGLHFNLNSTSNNQKFSLRFSGNYMADKTNLPSSDPINLVSQLPPDAPAPFNPDGTLNWANGNWPNNTNPFAYLLKTYNGNTYNLTANTVISYKIINNLNLSTTLGYNSLQQQETTLTPQTAIDPSTNVVRNSSFNNSDSRTWIIEPQINYQLAKGSNKFNALLGTTFQSTSANGVQTSASGFSSDQLLNDPLAAKTQSFLAYYNSNYRYSAIYGRISYSYDDKYLVNITVRRDGSSRFGPGKQFGNFGAVGGAWIFSKEKLIENNLTFLSFGKLRVSYGTSGNDQIGDYAFLDTYGVFAKAPYGGINGYIPTSLANPDLAWEVNKKFEAGLEVGFFKDRVYLTASYYRNRSSNQLVPYGLSSVTGFLNIQENLPALVQNIGQEYGLQTQNIQTEQFHWSTNLTFSLNRNKLISYPGLVNSATYVIGQPLGIQQLLRYAGVNSSTGVYQFYDKNGVVTSNPDPYSDNTLLLNATPRFYAGIANSFKYKGFTLDFFFRYVKQIGQEYLYNFLPGVGPSFPQPVTALAAWKKPGDIANIQRYNQDFSIYDSFDDAIYHSNQLYKDASFLRLENLSLSYQLSTLIARKLGAEAIRVYVQGQNLLTFTNYIGIDPSAPTSSPSGISPLKVIVAGIQITL